MEKAKVIIFPGIVVSCIFAFVAIDPISQSPLNVLECVNKFDQIFRNRVHSFVLITPLPSFASFYQISQKSYQLVYNLGRVLMINIFFFSFFVLPCHINTHAVCTTIDIATPD